MRTIYGIPYAHCCNMLLANNSPGTTCIHTTIIANTILFHLSSMNNTIAQVPLVLASLLCTIHAYSPSNCQRSAFTKHPICTSVQQHQLMLARSVQCIPTSSNSLSMDPRQYCILTHISPVTLCCILRVLLCFMLAVQAQQGILMPYEHQITASSNNMTHSVKQVLLDTFKHAEALFDALCSVSGCFWVQRLPS